MSAVWVVALPLWAIFVAIVVGGFFYLKTTARVWDPKRVRTDQPDPDDG